MPGIALQTRAAFYEKIKKSVRCADELDMNIVDAQNKIQGAAGAASGGIDGALYKLKWSADGNHRVPEVNANSDGDFNWNLGNFENVWNDNNAFLCFCN